MVDTPKPDAGDRDEYNYKKDAHLQFTDFNQNCCVANGPMALAMIPQYAVMKKKDSGPVINFFAEGTSRVNFDSGSCEYVDLGLPLNATTFIVILLFMNWDHPPIYQMIGLPTTESAFPGSSYLFFFRSPGMGRLRF
jgi:hypothetical protein